MHWCGLHLVVGPPKRGQGAFDILGAKTRRYSVSGGRCKKSPKPTEGDFRSCSFGKWGVERQERRHKKD